MTARAHQITAVAIGGRALLIDGAPGSGKSSLALGLIDRGAVLIGDDGVMLEVREDALIVNPHPNTQGLIEVRNLGVLPFPVCPQAPASLVIRLAPNAPRFIDAAENIELLGISLPLILIDPANANLAL
ncbi:MAG: serine kinase, partial [Sphingomonadales bacterium]